MAANILSMCYEKGGWGDEGNSLFLKSWLRNSKRSKQAMGRREAWKRTEPALKSA